MIGWMVEKISSCGWRMKWRRLRPVTTLASVTPSAAPAARDGADGTNRRAQRSGAMSALVDPVARAAAVADRPRAGAVLARRRARELEEDVVEGRAGAARGRSPRSRRDAAPRRRPRSARGHRAAREA